MPPKHNCVDKFANYGITIDHALCIGCNMCVKACEYEVYVANETKLHPPHVDKDFQRSCVQCGQCAVVCPVKSIVVTDETHKLAQAAGKELVGLIAPATRFAIGEAFGQASDVDNTKALVRLLKEKLGFNKVFDVNVGADETTIIDTEEVLANMQKGIVSFTSCCPSWINLMETKYPDLIPNVSTAKSCVEMVGALVRHHSPESYIVEIMPCTGKKSERARQEIINCAITVVELIGLLKAKGVTAEDFKPRETDTGFDMPYHFCTGSAYIFGRTGGVGESVLRQVALLNQQKTYQLLSEKTDEHGLKYKTVKVNDVTLTLCVAAGGRQLNVAADLVRKGQMQANVVEMMACPQGCQSGGGMPKCKNVLLRGRGMDLADEKEPLKAAGQNKTLASENLTHEQIHHLYHTSFSDKSGK